MNFNDLVKSGQLKKEKTSKDKIAEQYVIGEKN
jgi:hypothetical protein